MQAISTIKQKNIMSNAAWFLILGVSFINLYFNTNAKDPFNTPKLIALLIIAGWCFGHLFKSIKDNYTRLTTIEFYFLIVVSAFLFFSSISALYSDNWVVALVGDMQRRNGLFAYLSLSVILLFASRIINFEYALRIYKVAIINGLLFSLYGLVQISGNDFISWNNPYNAIISTVGNPNFASAIMAVFAILSISAVLIKEISVYFKVIAICTLGCCLTAIVLSNSRQGLVSFSFALCFLLSVYFYFNRRSVGIVIIIVSTFGSVLAIMGMLQKGPLDLLYKASVSIRGYYWDAGVEMFLRNPVTGVGIDSYGFYFKEYRQSQYPLNYGFEITSSNAHNTFIQLFATGGFFVGFTYLCLVLSILIVGLKSVKKLTGSNQLVLLGILSSWVAFQAQSIISIDNIGISIWGWLLSGAVIGLARATNNIEGHEVNPQLARKKQKSVEPFQFIVSTIVLVPILICSVYLLRSETDSYKASGVGSILSPEQKNYIYNFSYKVTENPLADQNYKLNAAYSLYQAGYIEESSKLIKNFAAEFPRNEAILIAASELEEYDGNIKEAISYRKKISVIDPWGAKNYLKILQLYKLIGDIDSAKEYRDKILSFAAGTEIAKIAVKELG